VEKVAAFPLRYSSMFPFIHLPTASIWRESGVQGQPPLPEREVSSQKFFTSFPPKDVGPIPCQRCKKR